MIGELKKILPSLPELLKSDKWNTLLINKYPPIIYRLSLRLSDSRTLLLHKLFNTEHEQAFMHSHSWSFACKVLHGEYEMGVGYSEDRNNPPQSTFTSFVKAGDYYEILSPNVWHYTKPTKHTEYSYSVMLIGERCRERKAENNLPISQLDKDNMMSWFSKYKF